MLQLLTKLFQSKLASVQHEYSGAYIGRDPLKPIQQASPRDCAAGYHAPVPCAHGLQVEGLLYLLSSQCTLDVLLVGKYEQAGPGQALLLEQAMQLLAAVLQTLGVSAVHHPDHGVRLQASRGTAFGAGVKALRHPWCNPAGSERLRVGVHVKDRASIWEGVHDPWCDIKGPPRG